MNSPAIKESSAIQPNNSRLAPPIPIEGRRSVSPKPFGRKILSGLAIMGADVAALITSFSIYASINSSLTIQHSTVSFGLLAALFMIYATAKGHYSRRIPFWDQLKELLKLVAFFAATQGAVSAFLPENDANTWLVYTWLTALLLIVLNRGLIREILIRTKLWQIPTIIIGDGENATETALALLDERHLGYEIVSFIAPSKSVRTHLQIKDKRIPVRPLNERTLHSLKSLGKPYIIIALERGGIDKLQNQIDKFIQNFSNISVAPALRGLPLFGARSYHFFSHEVMMLEIKNNLRKISSRMMKRSFDIIVATCLLIVLIPVFAIISYLVRKTGKQIFFGHTRIGRNGKPFKCYKFRSMVENSKEVLEELLANSDEARREWYRDFKLKDDPRITKIGSFLRRSSLDELPQLWNVLTGDMSLVGPRPVIEDEIPYYGNYVNYYYKSRPGMTGLWQVSGRNDIDYDSRVQLDVWYVSNWSLWNDIVIMVRTVTVVLNRSGAY